MMLKSVQTDYIDYMYSLVESRPADHSGKHAVWQNVNDTHSLIYKKYQ